MKGAIQSVHVSYFVHLTEDPDRLTAAVLDILGTSAAPDSEELLGHHGNRILRVTFALDGEEASSALRALASRLDPEARAKLLDELQDLIDEHSALHFRLDKQSVFGGRVKLGGKETIKVKVKPRLFLIKGGAPSLYRGLFEGA